uniref:SP34_0 protein n=1 Tax=Fopius arisanus TaxID=64838 RepID=A0A0C9RIF5_9HYME
MSLIPLNPLQPVVVVPPGYPPSTPMSNGFFGPLVFLLGLVGSNEAQYGSCDYEESVIPGKSSYIFNPGYTENRNYPPGISCRWTAKSNQSLQIKCEPFIIPKSPNRCSLDAVLIQTGRNDVHRYCGTGSLDLVSNNNEITVVLRSDPTSPGGRFFCVVQTVPEQKDSCRCGWKNPTRIVGGETTGINEYPMMAGIIDYELRIVHCGATIINNRQVLTAAHCIGVNVTPADIGILVGEHDIRRGDETTATVLHPIARIVLHPYWNPPTSYDNDIAIITTERVIDFNAQVGPACLPFQRQYDTFSGNYVDVLGWGSLQFGMRQSDTLQKIQVAVLTPADCQRARPRTNSNQMCTLAQGKDSCQFDSGGPLLFRSPATKRLILAGLVSFGSPSCGEGDPGINTRVGAYMNFIIANNYFKYPYCQLE